MFESLRELRASTIARVGAFVALIGPLSYLLVRQFAYLDDRSIPCCDYAVLELGSRAFLRGEQLTGLYSRQGWRHPGPAAFLWGAPFRLLPGDSFAEQRIAIVALAIGALAIALWFFHDRLPTRVLLGASVVFGGWMVRFDIRYFLEPWNPEMAMFWILAFVPCAAMSTAKGTARWAVAAIATGSMAVQCHLSAAPIVIIGLGFVIAQLWSRRSEPAIRRGAVIAAIVALILWSLPLIDLAFGDRNLWHILTVDDSTATGAFPWGTMLRNLVQIIGLGPSRQGYHFGAASPFLADAPLDGWQVAVALVSAGLAARLLVHRRVHPRLAIATAISISGLIATALLISVSGGEYFPYLLMPVVVIGPIVLACSLCALLLDLPIMRPNWLRPALVGAETIALVTIACILITQVPTTSNDAQYSSESLRQITAQISDNCRSLPDPAAVHIADSIPWTDSITIIAAIERCTTVRVEGHLGFVAGEPYQLPPGEDSNILVFTTGEGALKGTVIAENDVVTVLTGPFRVK